jgi:TonB family protein
VNAGSYAPPQGDLLFQWERPRRRRLAILGFIAASLGLHALCFYLFQVIYPPAISLLPAPARVSLIAPTSADARSFLNWVNAEDPALASQTQRPAGAREYQLPKLAHIPSYLTMPPPLKELPPEKTEQAEPAAMPPGPVQMTTAAPLPPPLAAPSAIHFSESLGERAVTTPALAFRASAREAPQTALFRVAVDGSGVVRFCLLAQSSGDAALDEQARDALARTRFAPAENSPNEKLTWATATIDFGTDVALPPATTEPSP